MTNTVASSPTAVQTQARSEFCRQEVSSSCLKGVAATEAMASAWGLARSSDMRRSPCSRSRRATHRCRRSPRAASGPTGGTSGTRLSAGRRACDVRAELARVDTCGQLGTSCRAARGALPLMEQELDDTWCDRRNVEDLVSQGGGTVASERAASSARPVDLGGHHCKVSSARNGTSCRLPPVNAYALNRRFRSAQQCRQRAAADGKLGS